MTIVSWHRSWQGQRSSQVDRAGALPRHFTARRRSLPEALPTLQERFPYRHDSFFESQIANRKSKIHFNSPTKRIGLSLKLRLVLILLILCCTVGWDQTTKHFAHSKLGEKGVVILPGGFGEFRFAENSGAFLSLGNSLSGPLRLTIFTVVVGVGLFGLLAYLVFGGHPSRLFFAGFGLVWAGGMSNLIDRVTQHGLVSDFMLFRIGPLNTGIFNVADVVVLIGGAVIVYDHLLRRHKQAHR